MSAGPAVLVTGLGSVGAFGCGAEELRAALGDGKAAPWSELDRAAGYHLPDGARGAYTVTAPLAPWLGAAEARRMSIPSRFAVAATRMALADAGLGGGRDLPDGDRTAVVISTAFGPCSHSEALLSQILDEGPEMASPFLFTESVANAPAAQIAIATRARGASITLCQREAGALLAVGRGAAEIVSGRVVRSLVGAVDELSPLLHALLGRFGALARGEEISRPFDRRRDGFVASEGATVLVLESEEAAAARGAVPLARLLGWGSAFDPSAPPTGWGEGHAGLGRSLRRSIARAFPGTSGSEPAAATAAPPVPSSLSAPSVPPTPPAPMLAIDRIVSGASGTLAGDALEARMLRAAWGDAPLPPVLAPKGVVGEFAGGFLAAAVLAASGAPFGPTAGFAEPDPDLGLIPHDGSLLPAPRTLLATSLAAGGAAAWLVLGAP